MFFTLDCLHGTISFHHSDMFFFQRNIFYFERIFDLLKLGRQASSQGGLSGWLKNETVCLLGLSDLKRPTRQDSLDNCTCRTFWVRQTHKIGQPGIVRLVGPKRPTTICTMSSSCLSDPKIRQCMIFASFPFVGPKCPTPACPIS